MDSIGRSNLRRIGEELDRLSFPNVKNGGFVVPNEPAVFSTLGKEQKNESAYTGAAASRKQSPRSEAAHRRGSWSPRQTSPLVGASLRARYEDELDDVSRAYPGLLVWQTEHGLWLLAKSGLLTDSQRAAIFLVGISFAVGTVRSWGFWAQTLAQPIWIGPRHTNFPDGSICAFDLGDQTWVAGDSLLELIDFYTLWAFRHLYLEEFGRWPGPQIVLHPYERVLELKPDEYCGCGRYGKLYGDCCQRGDLARNQIRQAVSFIANYSGGLRKPPASVLRFAYEQREPPALNELFAMG